MGWLLELIAVPLPNWPPAFDPMAHKVPSVFTNSEWLCPAANAATPVVTLVGEFMLMVVPLPNWPRSLAPIANKLPSAFRNRVWSPPAATATTLLATLTG